MEYGSRLRWGAVITAIVLLLVIGIIGIVLIARNIFSGNDTPMTQTQEVAPLSDYNRPGIRVTLEVQGPVVAKEEHNAYRLIVSRTDRIMQVVNGYDGSIVKQERLDNTEEAFGVFLKALERGGFDNVNAAYTNEDERGACATGRRHIYMIEDEGIELFRTWNTTCGNDIGTSDAPRSVRTLFQKQFPNFSEFTRGLGLR